MLIIIIFFEKLLIYELKSFAHLRNIHYINSDCMTFPWKQPMQGHMIAPSLLPYLLLENWRVI